MYFKKSVDFIWSTNRQSVKQTLVNLTKGNMHKIYYKGIQYATSYSSASIYINYPDPIIHVLDYYSDIIDSRRGEKGEKGEKGDKKQIENGNRNITEKKEECIISKKELQEIDEVSLPASASASASASGYETDTLSSLVSELDCGCYYHDYMDSYECNACKEKSKSNKHNELFNLQYVEVLDKNRNESKIYTPKTNLPVEIEDGIYLSVEKLVLHRESKSSSSGAVDFKKVVFTLMTSRKNKVTKIYDFLKKCEDVYTKKIESRMTDKIFIYEFIQSEMNGGRGSGGGGGYNDDDDGSYGRRNQKMSNILCSEYELLSTKNLRTNCFFTDVDKIIKRIDFFVNNKEWYQARGIPYQLGLLFYGPAGCGKTSTIKAIAQLLERHIVNINDIEKIKKVTDLKNIFYGDYINGQYIPTNKRIYVIDEFDKILDSITAKKINNANANANVAAASAMAAFNMQMMGFGGVGGLVGGVDDDVVLSKVIAVDSDTSSNEGGGGGNGGGDESGKKRRKGSGDGGPNANANANANLNLAAAANMKPKYSFNDADMLTIMDGLVETSGRIIICTANDPSKISEIFKRPGRLDEHIEFTKCTQQMTIQLLELFYDMKLGSELLEKITNAGSKIEYKYSPAEINKICFHNIENIGGAVDEIVG